MSRLVRTALLPLGLIMGLILPGALFAQSIGDAAAGEALSGVCVACHGQNGNDALVPGSAKIGGQNEAYLLKQLVEIKSGERVVPLMTGILTPFDEQDLADLSAFYASQDLPLGVADESTVELAETLYRAGNASIGVAACAACHSPTGGGIGSAGFPALSGQDPMYTENQLRAFRSGDRTNDESAVMRDISARLSDQEIVALANYLAGLRAAID